ncbi:hypothetical protein SAMN05444392_11148 [Seinonella peptonophila]|uniref:Uncharacterized protein n=1 Tax=Seinonella peptonophila TaxID=112248 RepID=A0A1M4ZYC3_9BACL|nr:hypothetical protein SAMN05444392_11148 [Seinonella peptonophila]
MNPFKPASSIRMIRSRLCFRPELEHLLYRIISKLCQICISQKPYLYDDTSVVNLLLNLPMNTILRHYQSDIFRLEKDLEDAECDFGKESVKYTIVLHYLEKRKSDFRFLESLNEMLVNVNVNRSNK